MVRDSVAFRLYESWSNDVALAPLVLEACRRYGEEDSLHLLGFGCRFPLDGRGLIESLRALSTSHPPFVDQWVALAPLELVSSREEISRSVLSSRALTRLGRRRAFRGMKSKELWRRLEALCSKREDRARHSNPTDWDEGEDLIEALSLVEKRENVLERIADVVEGRKRRGGRFGQSVVDLTGAARIGAAVDPLLRCFDTEDTDLARAAVRALARIGTVHVIERVREGYPEGSRRFRRFALATLKAFPGETTRGLLHSLVDDETSPALRSLVFDALRFDFTEETAAVLKRELERKTSWMVPEEIQKALSVSAYVRGERDEVIERLRSELRTRGDVEVYFHIPFLDVTGEDG